MQQARPHRAETFTRRPLGEQRSVRMPQVASAVRDQPAVRVVGMVSGVDQNATRRLLASPQLPTGNVALFLY